MDPRCLTARRIFFDVLEIQALRVQVTFLTLPHLSEGGAASERSLWIERLLSHVGLLANVDGELSLRPLVLERAYGPKPVVFGLIAEHFQRQAYRQVRTATHTHTPPHTPTSLCEVWCTDRARALVAAAHRRQRAPRRSDRVLDVHRTRLPRSVRTPPASPERHAHPK